MAISMNDVSALPAAETMQRLLDDVKRLTSFDRRTTKHGERQSAHWLAHRLHEIGADDIAVTDFRSQSSWAPVTAAYELAALALSTVNGTLGRLLGVGLAISYELEVSGRNQWMRRLLPARRGVSVTARIPARGRPRRTLVLVAHHDAAHNGVVWHPRTVALNRMWSNRTGETVPTHAPVLAAMAAQLLPVRPVRRTAQLVLAGSLAATIQSARTYTTPGANDNATGVATVLELAGRLVERRLPDTEVLLVFPGGEEAGNTGMRAWVRNYGRRLDPAHTLLINLDSLGSGGHLVVARREGLTGRLGLRDVEWASRVAARIGIPLHTVSFPNVCDTSIARYEGMHAISLLSYDSGWIRNLHQKCDTVDQVRWNTVGDAITLVEELALTWSQGSSS